MPRGRPYRTRRSIKVVDVTVQQLNRWREQFSKADHIGPHNEPLVLSGDEMIQYLVQ